MNREDVIGVVLGIGVLFLLGAGFLRLGAMLNRRYPRATGSSLWASIHAVAILAFLIGCLLAWMGYHSDTPMRRLLFFPLLLPLIIYGSLFLAWLKSFAFLVIIRAVSKVFRHGI